jgi:hypothetical protein
MANFKKAMIGFAIVAAALFTPAAARAQGMSDVTQIYLGHAVTIGDKVLQPGSYTIEQMNIAGGASPVLTFRADDGSRTEVAAKTTPIVENRTQPANRVLFYRAGGKYYLDKIWVKGWNYGFQFSNPGNSKKHTASNR